MHAWMVDALASQAALAEMRASFVADALTSAHEVDDGGLLYAAEDVHAYIVARVAGMPARRPRPVARKAASRR